MAEHVIVPMHHKESIGFGYVSLGVPGVCRMVSLVVDMHVPVAIIHEIIPGNCGVCYFITVTGSTAE